MLNRNFIFVFILLVMLSIVNAIPNQLTTNFQPCPVEHRVTTPTLLSVSISPDPVVPKGNVTFTITGKLKKPITPDYSLYIIFYDLTGQCPVFIGRPLIMQIPNGTSVNVTINVPAPVRLPILYDILVGIVDVSVAPPDIIGCALAYIGTAPPSDTLVVHF